MQMRGAAACFATVVMGVSPCPAPRPKPHPWADPVADSLHVCCCHAQAKQSLYSILKPAAVFVMEVPVQGRAPKGRGWGTVSACPPACPPACTLA